MTKLFGILALVAIQALATTARSPCACARNLRPVCGSDGNTYNNECLLNCEKHKNNSDLSVASQGPCTGEEPPTCLCKMIYEPVCGNDGNTYPNKCAMLCTRSANPTIDLAHEGKCEDKVKVVTPCICTAELNEVCGSDGKTYDNPCTLNCATANDNTLSIKHSGRCNSVNVVDNVPKPPPCTCARDFKPVCGSDGVTYANDCLLNCATANDNTLSIKHAGKCEGDTAPEQPACVCTFLYKPVCGSDGVTYANDCMLNCATAKDNTLRIVQSGQCAEGAGQSCTCGREMVQVCGADGNTYNNYCLLECAGQTLAKHGPC